MRNTRLGSRRAALLSAAAISLETTFCVQAATVADWTFEEGLPGQAVTQVLDSSGNGHTGSIVWGAPVFVLSPPGAQGNVSISLPPGGPVGSGFRPQDSPAFNFPGQFTLEISFVPGTNNLGWRYLIGDFIPNGPDVLGLAYRSDPSSIGIGPLVGPLAVPFPLDGRSHHVAAVYSDQTLTLYLDGQPRSSTNINLGPTFAAPGSPMRLSVASDYNGAWAFNGTVDRVRISDQALLPEQFFNAGGGATNGCSLPAGLVGWWPGDGNGNDVVGGHDGTLLGGTSFVPGEVGQAFNLNGTDAAVRVPAAAALDVGAGDGLTLECWMKPTEVTQQQPLVEWNNGNFGVHFWISVPVTGNGPGSLFANVVDVIGPNTVYHTLSTAPGSIRAGVWQHVALTYDKATGIAVLFINGTIASQKSLGTFTPSTTADLYFGLRPFAFGQPDGERYQGAMDEISLYNRALTADEIRSIYQAGSVGKCPPPSYDGIPDAWRLQYFGTNFMSDPRAAANADPDGDAADNYQEFLAGTDPLASNSVPSLPAIVGTYAGATGGFQDGFRLAARFDGSITDLKYDSQGRIWLLEASQISGFRPGVGGQRVRILDPTNGVVTTLAGGTNGFMDGPLDTALFSVPSGLVFDSRGNAFIADQGNNRIREIRTNGVVTTFAGSSAGYRDGLGTNAQFNAPSGIAIDASNNLYVADRLNQKIRFITPQGTVTTFGGTYGSPADLAIARDGTLYVADALDGAIVRIDPTGVTTTFAAGLFGLQHVSVDAAGNVYASTGNQVLDKFLPDGTRLWSVGSAPGYRNGLAAMAQFIQLGRPLALPDGSLIIGDYDAVRQITLGIPPLLLINPPGGTFTNSLDITLDTSVPGGLLRYSLDGTQPGTNSPIYVNGITLTNTTAVTETLQAVVLVNNHPVSQVASATFTNAFNSWRAQVFGANFATDPQAAATADPDGDGSSNYQEFLDGTNPLDPKSVKIRVAARIVPLITWNSVSNTVYRVLRKDDINSTNVVVVAPSVLATNTISTFIDLNPDLNGFYWVELAPPGPGR